MSLECAVSDRNSNAQCPFTPQFWSGVLSPEAIILLLEVLLAAERGTISWQQAQEVVRWEGRQFGLAKESIHDKFLSTSLLWSRQQKMFTNPGEEGPVSSALTGIIGRSTVWFGRLPMDARLQLLRMALQSGLEFDIQLVSSLRESLIEATKPVNNP